MSNQVSTQ